MSEFDSEPVVVIPDLHGHADLLEASLEKYDDDVNYVLLGDAVDKGLNTKKVIEIVKQYQEDNPENMQLLLGNHEWSMLGAISCNPHVEITQDFMEAHRNTWMGPIDYGGGNTLSSYGIHERGREAKADALKHTLESLGHLTVLRNAALYFENEDFIAVHAGLTNHAWEIQRATLDQQRSLMRIGYMEDKPAQIGSFHLANQEDAFEAAQGRTVVTGHSHFRKDPVTADGQRVRLATELSKDRPFYVWESWSGDVVEIDT